MRIDQPSKPDTRAPPLGHVPPQNPGELSSLDPGEVGRESEPVREECRWRGAAVGEAGLELEPAHGVSLSRIGAARGPRRIFHPEDVPETLVADQSRVVRAVGDPRAGIPVAQPVRMVEDSAPDDVAPRRAVRRHVLRLHLAPLRRARLRRAPSGRARAACLDNGERHRRLIHDPRARDASDAAATRLHPARRMVQTR